MTLSALLFSLLSLLPLPSSLLPLPSDSVRVEQLLREPPRTRAAGPLMTHFARQLLGLPYVAQTLEAGDTERLVVNLRQLDCTTYVETVLALTLCARDGERTYGQYCRRLAAIRYAEGRVDYRYRLHYFSSWILWGEQQGRVSEVQQTAAPFTRVQQVTVNYMSAHTDRYPMLVRHPEWVPAIIAREKEVTGLRRRYIPKSEIRNTQAMRRAVHDGDILAITTSKAGLDIAHVGIAVWHRDGLHLINASQIHGRTVEESMTLRQYMKRHPSQTGIRVIRIKN